MKGFYNLDINATTTCNLRCTYCIEHDWFDKKVRTPDENLVQNIKDKMNFLLASPIFLNKFGGIGVYFWGGEPTLNPTLIQDMVDHFSDVDNVQFFIYSNGYNINPVMDLLLKYKDKKIFNGQPKLLIQISYDGLASHNVARVNVAGKGSALQVKENLYKIMEAKIPVTIKPTIGYDNLDKISDNYFEFRKILEYGRIIGNETLSGGYSPTIDYLSDYSFSEEETKKYNDIVRDQLIIISKSEKEYYLKNNKFFFSWLNPSKALCGAGSGLGVIDLNGDVLVCHGALYEEARDEHKLANILDSNEDFLKDIINSSEEYTENKGVLPDECKECFTHYCMKCNVKKHTVSNKETYYEKWNDFTDQPHLCKLFKFLGVFRISLLKVINK